MCTAVSQTLCQSCEGKVVGTVRSNPLPRATLFLEQQRSSCLPLPLKLLLAPVQPPFVLPLEPCFDLWDQRR